MKTKRNYPVWLKRLVLVTILIAICIVGERSVCKNISANKSRPKISEIDSSYSDQELHSFWDQELKTIIEDGWAPAKLPYSELNSRFTSLNTKIFARTGSTVAVSKSTKYHRLGKRIQASTGINETNNTVNIEIYVPSMFDGFKELRLSGRPDWHEAFEANAIIIMMHEMEHAVRGNRVRHIDTEEESSTWADTCKFTIVPLVEKYGLPVHGTEEKLYKAWKLSGEDPSKPAWRDAIEHIYGQLDGKK